MRQSCMTDTQPMDNGFLFATETRCIERLYNGLNGMKLIRPGSVGFVPPRLPFPINESFYDRIQISIGQLEMLCESSTPRSSGCLISLYITSNTSMTRKPTEPNTFV